MIRNVSVTAPAHLLRYHAEHRVVKTAVADVPIRRRQQELVVMVSAHRVVVPNVPMRADPVVYQDAMGHAIQDVLQVVTTTVLRIVKMTAGIYAPVDAHRHVPIFVKMDVMAALALVDYIVHVAAVQRVARRLALAVVRTAAMEVAIMVAIVRVKELATPIPVVREAMLPKRRNRLNNEWSEF